MTTICTDDRDRSRFTLAVDGEIRATLAYTVRGTRHLLTHAFTEPSFRGNGYAGQLVEYAVDAIAADPDAHIVPACGYVRGWFAEHPERAELLA